MQNRVLSAYHNIIFHPASANVLQMCAKIIVHCSAHWVQASFLFPWKYGMWHHICDWRIISCIRIYMSCHYHACLQNMCLFDQFLDFSRKHKKRRPLKWVRGVVDSWSVSSHCHFTNVCIYVVHFYLLRKAKVNYKFYKCNVAVKC